MVSWTSCNGTRPVPSGNGVKEGETRKGSGRAGPGAVCDQTLLNTYTLGFGGRVSAGLTALNKLRKKLKRKGF